MKSQGKEVRGEAFRTQIESPDFTKTYPDIYTMKVSNDQGNMSLRMLLLNFSSATRAKDTLNHSWVTVCQAGSSPALKAGLQVSKWLVVFALKLITHPKIIQDAWAEFKGYNILENLEPIRSQSVEI